jgi:hypothetical protein
VSSLNELSPKKEFPALDDPEDDEKLLSLKEDDVDPASKPPELPYEPPPLPKLPKPRCFSTAKFTRNGLPEKTWEDNHRE